MGSKGGPREIPCFRVAQEVREVTPVLCWLVPYDGVGHYSPTSFSYPVHVDEYHLITVQSYLAINLRVLMEFKCVAIRIPTVTVALQDEEMQRDGH